MFVGSGGNLGSYNLLHIVHDGCFKVASAASSSTRTLLRPISMSEVFASTIFGVIEYFSGWHWNYIDSTIYSSKIRREVDRPMKIMVLETSVYFV